MPVIPLVQQFKPAVIVLQARLKAQVADLQQQLTSAREEASELAGQVGAVRWERSIGCFAQSRGTQTWECIPFTMKRCIAINANAYHGR
jgi:hypothetical protein